MTTYNLEENLQRAEIAEAEVQRLTVENKRLLAVEGFLRRQVAFVLHAWEMDRLGSEMHL